MKSRMCGFRISPVYNDSLETRRLDLLSATPGRLNASLSDVTHSSAARTAVKGNSHRRGDRRRQTGGYAGYLFCMCSVDLNTCFI